MEFLKPKPKILMEEFGGNKFGEGDEIVMVVDYVERHKWVEIWCLVVVEIVGELSLQKFENWFSLDRKYHVSPI